MTRVKRGTTALKRRRSILKAAKGYRLGRSKKEKQAKEALLKAGSYAFAHRRKKKGDFRRLWNVRINSELRKNGTTYSKFINLLLNKKIIINRKVLSELASENPEIFKSIVEKAKS